VIGLGAIGVFGGLAYNEYQKYLHEKQALDIARDVKRRMNEPYIPILPKDDIEQRPKQHDTDKDAEEKPQAVSQEVADVVTKTAEAQQSEPEKPKTEEKPVVVEAKAEEPTLTFQPVPPSLKAIPIPEKEFDEEPPKPSGQESQLSSMIHELQTSLEKAREEIKSEQSKREEELLKKMEDSLTSMMNEFIPMISKDKESKSTAHVLASRMSYEGSNPQAIQDQVEELIKAYESRIENLGLRNYDIFYERLQAQRKKWKRKLRTAQEEHSEVLVASIQNRDSEWKTVIDAELTRAEDHFQTQSKIDEAYIRQQAELELTIKHQQEVHSITELLAKETESRLAQISEIISKIREMEAIQNQYFAIIEKLRSVHEVHLRVESMQRTLNCDSGSFTQDLEGLKTLASSDEVVQTALSSLSNVHSDMVQRGIPTMQQLLKEFAGVSKRARKAALMKAKTLTDYVLASVAVWFIPRNIWTVDDNNTLSILKAAEELLRMGDLAGAERALNSLSGFPREEVEGFLQDLRIRLQLAQVLETLSYNSLAVVNSLVAPRIAKGL